MVLLFVSCLNCNFDAGVDWRVQIITCQAGASISVGPNARS